MRREFPPFPASELDEDGISGLRVQQPWPFQRSFSFQGSCSSGLTVTSPFPARPLADPVSVNPVPDGTGALGVNPRWTLSKWPVLLLPCARLIWDSCSGPFSLAPFWGLWSGQKAFPALFVPHPNSVALGQMRDGFREVRHLPRLHRGRRGPCSSVTASRAELRCWEPSGADSMWSADCALPQPAWQDHMGARLHSIGVLGCSPVTNLDLLRDRHASACLVSTLHSIPRATVFNGYPWKA